MRVRGFKVCGLGFRVQDWEELPTAGIKAGIVEGP